MAAPDDATDPPAPPPGAASADQPAVTRTYRQVRFEHPPGSCELVLVRHGESAAAHPDRPFLLVEGRGDPPLSKEGEAQAERLAERLSGTSFDACYVTPLQRTHQTAAPLARRLGLEPVVEPRLIEVHMGDWEGGRYRERIAAGDPLAARVFLEERWDVVPGAESNDDLFARTGAAVSDLADRHRGGRVLVVAHAVSIAAVLAQATRSSPLAFVGADNASISVLVAVAGRNLLRRFNDAAHLEGLDRTRR